jgi:hypothetical protein
MKQFLIRLSVFSLCLVGLLMILIATSSWLSIKNNDFKIKKTTKYILLGHSHAECAYNDSIIDNLENFSQSGESYFYTLPKIKEIIRSNPQVKTIFLEFTNNQLTKKVEEWIAGKKYLGYYYATYFPYIESENHLFVLKSQPLVYTRNLPIVCKDLLKKSISKHPYPYEFGGFKALQGTLDSYKTDKKQHRNEDFVEIKRGVSKIQLHYLQEIIAFLKDKKIELILIRSPQHKSYQGFANEKDFDNVVKNELAHVKFIDLVNFPLSDNDFRDPEHLNGQGAKKLSKWFNLFLKEDITLLFKNQKHVSYQFINENKITKK